MQSMSLFKFLSAVLMVLMVTKKINAESCVTLLDTGTCVRDNSSFSVLESDAVVKSCPSSYVVKPFDGFEPSTVFTRVCQCIGKCGPDAHCKQIVADVTFKEIISGEMELRRIPVDCLCVKDPVEPGHNVDIEV